MASGPPPGIPDRRKRHEPRHAAEGVTANVGPIEAKVTDVSAGGMGIQSSEPLKVGRVMNVTVRLGGSAVDVTGIVRWCRMEMKKQPSGEVRPVYGAGLKLDIPVEKLQQLEKVTKLPLTAGPGDDAKDEQSEAPGPASGFELGSRR